MRTGLLAALLLCAGAAGAQGAPATQADMLKDWATARCLAKGFGFQSAAGGDATRGAGALLERGDYGADAYEALDRLIDRHLARRYGGSDGGSYVTLQCLDLRRSPELDRAVRSFRSRPAAR